MTIGSPRRFMSASSGTVIFPGPARRGRGSADGCSLGALLEGDVVDQAEAADAGCGGEHETASKRATSTYCGTTSGSSSRIAWAVAAASLALRVGLRTGGQRDAGWRGRHAVLGAETDVA